MVFSTDNQRDFATGPAFTPLPYSLLDTVPPVAFTGHQKKGVMYQVDACSVPNQYTEVGCSNDPGAPKEASTSVLWRATDPFVVYSWLPCTYVGEPPDKLKADTLAAHENNVKRRVGEIFWTGGDDGTNSQRLAADTEETISVVPLGLEVVLQTAATVVTGGGVLDVPTAIGQLEQEMAQCYGGTPYIHVPHGFIAEMSAAHLLADEPDSQGRLRTRAGSIVIGYAGTVLPGPDGTAPGVNQAWIYATGALKTWQSGVKWLARNPAEALSRSTNATVLIAEQWFMVGWDCCHFAALVSTV